MVVQVSTKRETETLAVLRFEVQDTGIGISPATQARLFQLFHQADGSLSQKYDGAGLGLAIARQLLKSMQGQMGMRSQSGKGSTFWFTAQIGETSERRKSPKKILSQFIQFQGAGGR